MTDEARFQRIEKALNLPAWEVPVVTPDPARPFVPPDSTPNTGRGEIPTTLVRGRPGEQAATLAVDHNFTWGQVGEVHKIDFSPGRVYSLAIPVPAEYRGWLAGKIVQRAEEFVSVPGVRFWLSTSPNGMPIAGTEYSGSWISGTLGGEEFKCWPQAGVTYFFNVVVRDAPATFGVQQDHQ